MKSDILFSDAPALITRRRGLFTLGALAATGLAQSTWAKGAAAGSGDAVILNAALALEFQAIAAYQVGAESKLLDKPVLDLAVQFQGHHKAHAAALTVAIENSGGVAAESKTIAGYAFPVDQLKSQADVLRFAAGLEKAAASAYVSSLANLRQKSLIKGAAAILGDETMHWAVLLNALGENPVPVAFIS